MIEVKVPELGEGIEKATVVEWHAAQGAQLNQDDDIVELVTDKATFNVAAPSAGMLKECCAKVGEEVAIGSTIAILE